MLEKESLSFDRIEEIIDGTSRQELKKSFPDECHFQTSRFFAKTVTDSLLRTNLVKKEGNRFVHQKQLEKEKTDEKK